MISRVSGSSRSILEITRASALLSPESNRSTRPSPLVIRSYIRVSQALPEKQEYDKPRARTRQCPHERPRYSHVPNMCYSDQHVEDDPDPQRARRSAPDVEGPGGEGWHDALGLPALRDRAGGCQAHHGGVA